MYPSDRQYTKEHEWISVSGTTARVGITDYAQQQLGDVVFVELPDSPMPPSPILAVTEYGPSVVPG